MGLRELKKEKTRNALLDAALDLFLEQGYDATTIEQIAGVVDVSPRTFFRYFPSKDDIPLHFHDQGEETMMQVLTSRPEDEPPFTSMALAVRAVIQDMSASTEEERGRFLKIRRLLELNPALVGKSAARGAATERVFAKEIARRRGTDVLTDQVAHLVVVFAVSTMRVGFECPTPEGDLASITDRMEAAVTLTENALRPGWDL
ncbi:TetR family transcriptional regulator [Nonomuraea longicatena]|uniref:TetR family transcriptional regulator n=1 Tax=Nonomuraea longicatena TaxID=83682 RepID=A0ABN1QHV4_9ACTN